MENKRAIPFPYVACSLIPDPLDWHRNNPVNPNKPILICVSMWKSIQSGIIFYIKLQGAQLVAFYCANIIVSFVYTTCFTNLTTWWPLVDRIKIISSRHSISVHVRNGPLVNKRFVWPTRTVVHEQHLTSSGIWLNQCATKLSWYYFYLIKPRTWGR